MKKSEDITTTLGPEDTAQLTGQPSLADQAQKGAKRWALTGTVVGSGVALAMTGLGMLSGGGAAAPEAAIELEIEAPVPEIFTAKSKTELIDSLMKQGVGAPTGQERDALAKELGVIDAEILNLVSQDGTRIGVASAGDDLVALGAIKPMSSAEVDAQALSLVRDSRELHQADQQIARAVESENPEEVAKASKNYHETAMSQIDRTILASPGMSPMNQMRAQPGLGGAMAQSTLQMLAMQPQGVSIESYAMGHGASTPKEIKQYTDLVKAMNAEHLPEYDRRGREVLQAQADGQGFSAQTAQLQLQNSEGKTMIAWNEQTPYVPDYHYHRNPGADADSESLILDGHDKRIVDSWGQGTTTMVDVMTEARANGGGYTEARHLPKSKLVLCREGGESAGVHELGHVVDTIVAEKDPEWHKEWSARAKKSYEARKENNDSITAYATADPGEYVAEGFSHYYENAEELKAKDPELFSLTQELVARAISLGSR